MGADCFFNMSALSRLRSVRNLSHDHNLLPPVEEVEVIPLSALPQGCSDEGLLFLEDDFCLAVFF